ncbi:hypothetical protein HDV06_004268 [Boothiomyces sp. JEL0866]|nr:hypothetical protein HDV06_004268 [Boothiomyces sp. JEL0866]
MTDLGFFQPAQPDDVEMEPEVEEQIQEPELEIILEKIEPEQESNNNEILKLLQKETTVENVGKIYKEIKTLKHLQLLEYQSYLDSLLPLLDGKKTTDELLYSICLMFNEKYRQQLPFTHIERFSQIFNQVLELKPRNLKEKQIILEFLINVNTSLEIPEIRSEWMKLVSISIWKNLLPEKLEIELEDKDRQKSWKKMNTKYSNAKNKAQLDLYSSYLSNLLIDFLLMLEENKEGNLASYANRFLEFLVDLLSQIFTRRYFNVLFHDHLVMPLILSSEYFKSQESDQTSFHKLVERLEFYAFFQIDDLTGQPLNRYEMIERQHEQMSKIQKTCFIHFKDDLQDFIFASLGSLEKSFKKHFENVPLDTLVQLASKLGIRTESFTKEQYEFEFILDSLAFEFGKTISQLEVINAEPLYPNEELIFDDLTVVPNHVFNNTDPIAIPKLGIQFLTLHDYLLRNFDLYKLECAHAIRQDLEDVVLRLNPKYNPDHSGPHDRTIFTGWSRMACPLNQIQIDEVGLPRLTELVPSFVKADLTYSLERYNHSVRKEWDAIRPSDTLFLVSLQMLPSYTDVEVTGKESRLSGAAFRKRFGINYIRGCEVYELLGDDGDPVHDFAAATQPEANGEARVNSHNRHIRVLFDTNQYQLDLKEVGDPYEIYGSLNVIVRRNAAQNNFKSVLETIRDLMQSELVVPDWLQDVVLGYGDRNQAHYTKMINPSKTIDFGYTFVDWNHLEASFPTSVLIAQKEKKSPTLVPPYILTFPDSDFNEEEETSSKKRKSKGGKEGILVKSYRSKSLVDKPKVNKLKFTPTQVEAIRSGCSTGLTLIVGPPGTGKTDVAVQIIANIYNQHPNTHMLLITKSNQALNHLFEKITNANINPRHLLRLGHGHEDLNSTESWGKAGRLKSFLELRLSLLKQIETLASSLLLPVAHAHTCENAGYFFTTEIEPRWIKYNKSDHVELKQVIEEFPFTDFIKTIKPKGLSNCQSVEEALEIANDYYAHIEHLFRECEQVRPFELLRTNKERANYLLVKEARIIAMTSTHASLKRRELVRLGFKYDTVIMEEAGQMLEVESFIPLLLQTHDTDLNRSPLSRIVLIGDHHQLPPIVQSQSCGKYANMEQSLFKRLIRLGVPSINLDHQGRSRSSIADLYRWNYENLSDLPLKLPGMDRMNAGFVYEYQAVNVGDFNGQGETAPRPHFIQNLGEAEYVVAVYQYMRLLGYPSEKIAILTTYNGQKELINDVLNKRCSWNPLFKTPVVSTVDQFQGQQADFVLLSLVRTKHVGHLRDVRRLTVALSRARLGLYVFCRFKLFSGCAELAPAFNILKERPTLLQLTDERYGEIDRSEPEFENAKQVGSVTEMGKIVAELSQKEIESLKKKLK